MKVHISPSGERISPSGEYEKVQIVPIMVCMFGVLVIRDVVP